MESDRFTAFVNLDPSGPGTPLLPAYQQTVPDLGGLGSDVTTLQQPRALQRQGRRDLYVETWGLTIDHELPANFLASAQYLGSRGVRLFSRGGVNFCITKPDVNGNCTRTLDQFYPGGDPYGSVDFKSDIGASTYHALLLSLERRFTNGLSLQTHYTWSHSINDGSVGGGESNGPENVNCLACDKGPSVFDIRNSVTANAVYELPFGPGKRYFNAGGVLGKVVGRLELQQHWPLAYRPSAYDNHEHLANAAPRRERPNHTAARPCSRSPLAVVRRSAESHDPDQSRSIRPAAA